jgi:hypothetical protein
MKNFRGLILVGAVLSLSPAGLANIVAISEVPPAHTVAIFTTPGVVALCEFGVALNICQNGAEAPEGSVFPGTLISDFVVFANNLSDIYMCSDPNGEPTCLDVNGRPTSGSLLAAAATKFIAEAAPVGGVELTNYAPGAGEPGALDPGFLQTYNITSDTPGGDAPEPASVLLICGAGLILGAKALRERA